MSNLRSVAKAFEAIGCQVRVSDDPRALARAERLVLPGDGAFAAGMEHLRGRGLLEPLREAVVERGVPFLGICLGMQLLARRGWEHGCWDGLNWIPAEVRPLDVRGDGLKVPHVGWDDVVPQPDSVLLADLPTPPAFYFIHSYHVACEDPSMVKGVCTYGVPMAAVLESHNIMATQFHPEKSQRAGLQLLRNFVERPPGAG